MKWRHQLRILLWKNWTLKKRNIGMTLMETLIPLILVVIMLVLRLQVSVEPNDSRFNEANPLPSAGFIPILQTFCSNTSGSRSSDSFREQSGSVADTTMSILTVLTDWLFPGRPPGSKTYGNPAFKKLMYDIHTNPWGFYKDAFSDGNVDLVSLWDEHKPAILAVIGEVEGEVERHPFFAQNILNQVNHLNKLAEKRQRENPVPTADDGGRPLPPVCSKYINRTGPPNLYEDPNWHTEYSINGTDGNNSTSNGTTDWLKELQKIWRVTEAVVCSEPSPPTPGQYMFGTLEGSLSDIPIGDMILRTLANNPKILYGPTDTEADRIVENMLGTLGILDDLTALSEEWLRLSERIKGELNDTQTWGIYSADPSGNSASVAPSTTKATPIHSTGTTSTVTQTASTTKATPTQTKSTASTVTPTPVTAKVTPTTTTKRPQPRPRDLIRQLIMKLVNTLDWVACRWLYIAGEDLNIKSMFKGFKTEEEIVDYFLNQAKKDKVAVLSSIFFQVNDDGTLPEHMVYKIRQNATISQSTKLVKDLLYEPGPNWKASLYYVNGFVWLQDLTDRAIINIYTKGKNETVMEPGVYVEQVATPCYIKDEISLVLIQHMLPMVMMLSWVFPVAMLARGVVYEKEMRLKEIMKLMGLERSVHWVGWFIVSIIQMFITMSLLAISLALSRLMAYTNFFLLWLMMLNYGLNAVLFSFFISTLFNNAKIAAACSGIFWMMTYVPYMFLAILENGGQPQHYAVKTAMSLFTTTGLGLSGKYINFQESSGVGLQFWNANDSMVREDRFSPVVAIVMSLVSSAVYIILTWYIDNVMPGDYGVPNPWYFPLTRTYWRGRPNPTAPQGVAARLPAWMQDTLVKLGYFSVSTVAERMVQQMMQNKVADENSKLHFEEDPTNSEPSVVISQLTKIYGNGKLAVNDLSLNLYEGQILSFLGHNGAGKTTTMSILTGMIPPTTGLATIYGQDIRREMDEIRKSLGMCPQHNVLFDSMTVEEHLKFYCRLKGAKHHAVDMEVEAMLSDSGLRDKRDSPVSALSGGMKRKLSIGVAFIAGSRTVILDEPTAGVDPWSRREIWDLILKFKHERTIMLSTHHMDEADILGDRIAVISHGQLKAGGSSLFMKGTFGDGYHLIIAKKMQRATDQLGTSPPGMSVVEPESAAELKETSAILTRCSETKVTRAVQMHVASAYLRAETPRELHYILPFAEIKNGRCGPLFDYLDKSYHRLDIDSYGVSDTSIEEVFLKVTMDAKVKQGEVTLAAMNADEETGAFDQQYTSFGHIDQNGRRNSTSSTHSLPSRLRRSLRGKKRKEQVYEPEEPQSYTVESSDGRVYTPDPIRRDLARRRSGRRPRANSAENVDPARKEGKINPAYQRSLSDDESYYPREEDRANGHAGRNTRRPQEIDRTDIIPAKDRVNEGAGSYVVTGFRFLLYQFHTCMYKKAILTAHNWKAIISQIVLPVIFITFAMFVGLIGGPRVQDEPALEMSTSMYLNVSKGLGNHYVPYASRSPSYNWSYDAMPWDIMQTFKMKSGIGATCVLESKDWADANNDTYGPRCDSVLKAPKYPQTEPDRLDDLDDPDADTFIDPRRRYYPNCRCYSDRRGMDCDKGGFTTPPAHKVITTDIVQNITGDNMTEFMYYTTDIYKLSRYGAIAVGYERPSVPYWMVNLPMSLQHLHVRQATKAIYNSKGWHAMPVYVNAINNAILRANLPKSRGNPAAYGITVINHPMKGTSGVNAAGSMIFGSELIIAIMMVTGLAFIPAGFVVFLVQERASKAKHLQFVSGLNPLIYWISNILWDMLMYLLPAACCIIIIKAFGVKAFSSNDNFPAVVVLIILFGWSCTPLLYPATYMFKDPSAAYVFLAVFNILLGVGCLFVTFLLDYFRKEALTRVSEILKSIFVVIPTFSLGRGLMDVVLTDTANDVNRLMGRPDRLYPFDWKVTGRNNLALLGVGAICYILTILIEYKFFFKPRVVRVQTKAVEGEDDDVAAERQRLLNPPDPDEMVRLENLTKIYTGTNLRTKHLAVDKLCLGVPKGECFGMLGVNGAGKTTTFKMLTGDHPPTGGDARIASYSILKDMNEARRHLGYCPQFDAIFEELTARQHLTIYAKLRGVPIDEVPAVVEWALTKLELMAYADKAAGTYSGGNKRKLSTAIALLGNPPVIFLDEPTAGMDPYAKRFLWDLVLGLIEEGRCIILTSHSMEECETLCTRLSIMVAGRFRCLGSVQHLKSRYGGGYGLKLTVPGPNYDSNMRRVVQFLTVNMPLATLKERHHNMIEYEFTPTDYKLSFVFDKMRQAMSGPLPVEEYSICQHTLDNVFIDFVKEQAGLSDKAGADDGDDNLLLQGPMDGINPIYKNLIWLDHMTPDERKEKLEDLLVALTRRLESEGSSLKEADTWNTILDILKGNDATELSRSTSEYNSSPAASRTVTTTHSANQQQTSPVPSIPRATISISPANQTSSSDPDPPAIPKPPISAFGGESISSPSSSQPTTAPQGTISSPSTDTTSGSSPAAQMVSKGEDDDLDGISVLEIGAIPLDILHGRQYY